MTEAAVDLLWIPLGAGAHVVRISGVVYEALSALVRRRPRRRLFHSALEVRIADATYVIEMAPGPDLHRDRVDVAVDGPVGSRLLGRCRFFRYQVRCWRGGTIPDRAAAVASPIRLTEDPDVARLVLDQVAATPALVWGRDELGTGDMWSCNSVISWVLATAGVEVAGIALPHGGRAPGWDAGIVLASSGEQSGPRSFEVGPCARGRSGAGSRG